MPPQFAAKIVGKTAKKAVKNRSINKVRTRDIKKYQPFGDPNQFAEDFTRRRQEERKGRSGRKDIKKISNESLIPNTVSGRTLRKILRPETIEQLTSASVYTRLKAVEVSYEIGIIALSWYLSMQLFLYFGMWASLGTAISVGLPEAAIENLSNTSGLVGIATNVTTTVLSHTPIIGQLIGLAGDVLDIGYAGFIALAILLALINTLAGILLITYAGLRYSIFSIEWFGGKHASLKFGLLITAIVGYMPLVQFLPWLIPLLIVVAIYPE